jgi:hypothetical protein
MSNRTGTAGKSTRQMAQRRRKTAIWMAIFVIVAALALTLVILNQKALGLGGGAVLALLIALRLLPDLMNRPISRQIKARDRADRGALAEEKVGDLLAQLDPQTFLVLHDIPSPYGNIDHIVIGKESGVYLLETKAHGGRVELAEDRLLVNRKPPEKDFIAQALKNTYWLRDEIEKAVGSKVWITPVVVFTNAFVQASQPVKGVHVVNKKYLPGLLKRPARSRQGLDDVWDAREKLADCLQDA